jgi:hypothetical protein
VHHQHPFDLSGPGVCTAHFLQGTHRMGGVAALTGRSIPVRFAETEGRKLEMQLREENTALAAMTPVVIDEAWYLWCVHDVRSLTLFGASSRAQRWTVELGRYPAPQCLRHGFPSGAR